ncbi:MAG TPA: class I SAM-dependent methyltransferase [Candidatus Rubrimentiphilum sp.]|nr:class I SAM-dependent methyltransferase [Candidatus Rubrimentiphilum sp.]
MNLSEHARKNRIYWDRQADSYQAEHGQQLARVPLGWGVWSIPESELRALGDVRDKDVLELGCGGAQWSIGLTRLGARCTGLDNSERQLEFARDAIEESGLNVSLLHASAESVPLPDRSFDIVFCDHGAMSFTDPELSVPEVARLLRPGGLFAFNAETPLHFVCFDTKQDRISTELHASYFDTRSSEEAGSVSFTLPYGAWVRLFRKSGFEIEELMELRPSEDATSSYRDWVSRDWARKWPAEQIWRLRRV